MPNAPGSAANPPRAFEQQQPGLSWSQPEATAKAAEFCSSGQDFHAINIPKEGGAALR